GPLGWVARAFGFRERMRMPGPGGAIQHAEMELADGVIMLGRPGADYQNPKRIGRVTGSLYVYVDEIDKHFERAREAGATILAPPEDQFYVDPRYGVEDPVGHQWYFAERVRDV